MAAHLGNVGFDRDKNEIEMLGRFSKLKKRLNDLSDSQGSAASVKILKTLNLSRRSGSDDLNPKAESKCPEAEVNRISSLDLLFARGGTAGSQIEVNVPTVGVASAMSAPPSKEIFGKPLPRIIYDDPHLQVLYLKGTSKYLLITFSSRGDRADGNQFFAKPVAEAASISAIGFVPKADNWFPERSVAAASLAIEDILSEHSAVLSYGASMGGYAALRYGRMLGVTHAIAFSPQWSIDPRNASYDPRWTRYYQERLNLRSEIIGPDLAENNYIFFDPFEKQDAEHVNRIKAANPSISTVPAYLSGHVTVTLYRGTASICEVFEGCLTGSLAQLRSRAQALARTSGNRARVALHIIRWRNPELALRIYEARYSNDAGDTKAGFYHSIADVYLCRRDFNNALTYQTKCLSFGHIHPDFYQRMGEIVLGLGRNEDALQWFDKALAITPDSKVLSALRAKVAN